MEVHGKSQSETATDMGCAVGTIKTLYNRAKKKMAAKDEAKKIMIVIPSLPATDRGKAYKDPVIKKIGYFLEQVCGCRFYKGEYSYMITMPAEQRGDLAWYKSNVAAKISVVGTGFDSEAKCRKTAGAMADIVFKNEAIDKIGWGIWKYHLDQMYVHYDVYEDLSQ